MNSNDPWRVMQAGTFVSDMAVPAPYFGHPFYGYGYPQGWATETGPDWENSGRRGAPVFVGSDTAVGDIFGDIGHALSSAADAVGGVLKGLKGPISVAAGAAATAFGGPAAGPVAAQLAGSLIDAAPGGSHPSKQAAAKKTVAVAARTAKTNAKVNVALNAAHHAISQTTMATLGHPSIPAQPGSLPAAVQKYLPIALKALKSGGDGGGDSGSFLQNALSAFGGGDGAAAVASGYPYAVVGSFWDDVKNAFLDVTLIKPTNQFIHDNHLEGIVQTGAGVVASIYGGPAAGAAASALAPSMMSLGVDDKKKAQAAQKNVQKITAAAAAHSPEMHQAVEVAKDAIKGTAASYHIHHLLQAAKVGDPQSQAALVEINQRATAGDSNAQAALHAIETIHQQQVQASAPVPAVPAQRGPIPRYPHPPYYGPPHGPPYGPPYYGPFYPPMMSGNIHGGLR